MQQDHDRQEHIAASLSLSTIRGRNLMVLFLTCVSSSMDALSYLKLGHVFIANMTGNTILFGLALGQGRMQDVLYAGVALVGFCLGVASGAIIPRRILALLPGRFTLPSCLRLKRWYLLSFVCSGMPCQRLPLLFCVYSSCSLRWLWVCKASLLPS
jgi:hypothetical protein